MTSSRGRGTACLLAVVLAACPGTTTESGNEGGGVGDPCVTDHDCVDHLCQGGVCASRSGSGGVSSSQGASGGASSEEGASGASGMRDGGVEDARVPAGHIQLDPDPAAGALEFGAVRVGNPVSRNVLVTNTGVAPATVVTLGFRENTQQEFSLEVLGGQPTALAVDAQVTLRITYRPVDAEPDLAYLTVVTNADNAVVELPLTAEFKGTPVLAVTATPASLDDVSSLQVTPTPVGIPVVAHLYVKNAGASDSALTVESVTLDPPASALFSLQTGPLPRTVSSWVGVCTDLSTCGTGAESCVDGLCVSPAAGGNPYPLDVVDAALTFNAGQAGEATTAVVVMVKLGGTRTTRRVQVAALAQDSRLEVTPSPVDLGEVFLGRTRLQQVTLKNPDDASSVLELSDITIRYTPSPYAVELGGLVFPYPLTPGSSTVVTVVFSPTNAGTSNNNLSVARSNGLPLYVPITGTGVQEPEIDVAASLEFGGVIPGSPRTVPLAIRNVGLGPLRVTSLSVTPTTSPFSVSPAFLPDLAPGATSNVQVTYAPAAAGTSDAATLLVQSNDPDRELVQVALTGQGVVPLADVSPAAGLDFGSVLIGLVPAPTRDFTVRNNGQGTLTVDSPARVKDTLGVDMVQYLVTPSRPLPAGVTSGDAMTFTVAFSPTAPAHHTGSLTITTNDPDRPTFTLPVTGAGNTCSPLPFTTVNVINGTECAYQCVADAVPCSDSSCVWCPVRHAATPSCSPAKACEYTCPATTGEPVDPGNTCAGAYNLGNVRDGSTRTTSSFRIHPQTDHDWFRFKMEDQLDIFHEGFVPFTTLRATVRLAGVPAGETLGFELVQDNCAGGGVPQTVGAGQVGQTRSATFCDNYSVDGNNNTVPIDDSRIFYVHVYPVGDSYSCSSYELTVEVDEEFFSGLCL